MKYRIYDKIEKEIVLSTDSKKELDFYINGNGWNNIFEGFYYENDEMIIETAQYNIIIKGE